MNFIKLNNKIFRNTQIHLNKVLKKFDLSIGLKSYLFILENCEGVSLHETSKKIGNDKAMTTCTFKRPIELEYVFKLENNGDCRAYQLYLIKKDKEVLPQVQWKFRK